VGHHACSMFHPVQSPEHSKASADASTTVQRVLAALMEPLPPSSVPQQCEQWGQVLRSVGDLTATISCGEHVLGHVSRRLAHTIAGDYVGGQAWVAALEDCGRNFVERCVALIEGSGGVPPTVLPRLLGCVVQLAEVLGSVAPLFRAIESELATVNGRVVRLELLYKSISQQLDVTTQSVAMLEKIATDTRVECGETQLRDNLCSKHRVPQCSNGLASVTPAKVGNLYAVPHDMQEVSPRQPSRVSNCQPGQRAELATPAMTKAGGTPEIRRSRVHRDDFWVQDLAGNKLPETIAAGLFYPPEHNVCKGKATWGVQTACVHSLNALMGGPEQTAAAAGSHFLNYGLACLDALPNADPLSALARAAFSHVAALLKEVHERHPFVHSPELTSHMVTSTPPTWEGLDRLTNCVAAWAEDELAPVDASLAKSVAHSAAGLKALVCLVN